MFTFAGSSLLREVHLVSGPSGGVRGLFPITAFCLKWNTYLFPTKVCRLHWIFVLSSFASSIYKSTFFLKYSIFEIDSLCWRWKGHSSHDLRCGFMAVEKHWQDAPLSTLQRYKVLYCDFIYFTFGFFQFFFGSLSAYCLLCCYFCSRYRFQPHMNGTMIYFSFCFSWLSSTLNLYLRVIVDWNN